MNEKKGFWKQTGKAACYFLLYLGLQTIVSVAFQFVYGFVLGIQIGMSGEAFDAMAVTQQVSEAVYRNLTGIILISNALTLLFLWLFFKIRKKHLLKEADVVPVAKNYVPTLIVIGIAMNICISFVLTALPDSVTAAYAESSMKVLGSVSVIGLISDIIMAPLAEEVVFRGLMLSRMKKGMRTGAAVVLSSLAFGLAHGQLLWITYTFVMGILFAVIAIKLHSVLSSIIMHVSFNAVGVALSLIEGEISKPVCAAIAVVGGMITAAAIYFLMKKQLPAAEEKKNTAMETAV